MLKVVVPAKEWFNEKTNEFLRTSKETTLLLEHSLISLSKWEAKWKKPFLRQLDEKKLPLEELIDYIRCMTINQGIDPIVYLSLTDENHKAIAAYIGDSMTATTITRQKTRRGRPEIVTSELIYYWMTVHNIPFECEKWHLNRLMTLIEVCAVKSAPDKKMSKKDILKQNAALNAQRMSRHHTKG